MSYQLDCLRTVLLDNFRLIRGFIAPNYIATVSAYCRYCVF